MAANPITPIVGIILDVSLFSKIDPFTKITSTKTIRNSNR